MEKNLEFAEVLFLLVNGFNNSWIKQIQVEIGNRLDVWRASCVNMTYVIVQVIRVSKYIVTLEMFL